MSLVNLLKTSILALLATALFGIFPALAAGTLPLAMAQQVDINGRPLAGCQVSFFVAGSVAQPQNSYSDFGLSQNPNPILFCDQTGRIPMFWLADGLVHVRMTDNTGSPIVDTTMQVLGPSAGGGGGGSTVDPTTLIATGDLKVKYGAGPLTGFVRANGLTIGAAGSGATERANADTQTLFIYLYGVDPNLVVSGGRTGNALSDFNANKTIALPDWRGRAIAALDDMGNAAAGRLTTTYFGAVSGFAGTTLGGWGGNEKNAGLVTANLPPYTPTVASSNIVNQGIGPPQGVQGLTAGPVNIGGAGSGGTLRDLAFSLSLVMNPQGGTSSPFAVVSPMMLATIYLKL